MMIEKEKSISGCGLCGFINEDGTRVSGEYIIRAMKVLHDRSNGLGGGFAGYGIYPEMKDLYAFHIMYQDKESIAPSEKILRESFIVYREEDIPTKRVLSISNPPLFKRYFVEVDIQRLDSIPEEDYVVNVVMRINSKIPGAFVISSGKNMGAFKGVGYPEDIGEFFRLNEYSGHIWIGHGRFPTNTPGWWGGAHPFTILDWAIVHNGEISSYGINRRYLEMFGYKCTMLTDTEVVAYLFDLLHRRHKISLELTSKILASPFWKDIDDLQGEEKEVFTSMRIVYGSALLNGPFAILVGFNNGLLGLNDRIKLRPMVAARKGYTLYIASEESAIREICEDPDIVWSPKAGTPVIGKLMEGVKVSV